MFETQLTIIGNLLAAPEWRRTTTSGQLAASFRVASTSRRWDKTNGEWIDGQSLRVRVTCWRRLAEGVVQSLTTGDPVVVVGRLYTRDWIDENGVRRVLYEMDAVAVGHDLSRGIASFTRTPSQHQGISVIEDEEEARRIGGEDSEPFHVQPINAEDAAEDEDDLDDLAEEKRVLAPA
ncbi:single-stranded DNA-binding protein 1 [Rhizocola hellebori]|uniref:Single-stranded DNA-binding protein n=1 Tax=Rhizocola hellebori TaxID=1392758 RepID=A0A8J3QEF2_9ACTN|nr:single-stranded DNA-binding protein [Rhizocola hellebori]GIH09315.1 single-stranded DNA-binding protein 1 [Rhizocola hellebori]